MKNITKKQKLILIIIVAILSVTLIGATFAFFLSGIGNAAVTPADLTSSVSNRLEFIPGDAINIVANYNNFNENTGSLTDETTSQVVFTPTADVENDSETYNVYLEIEKNDFEYTQDEKTPELILSLYDNNGNEVTEIDGLKYVTPTDYKTGETISGFDITEIKNSIALKKNIVINGTAPTETIHEWDVKITFINIDADQTLNEGKTLSMNLILQKELIIHEQLFNYTGSSQEFVTSTAGVYKIETWGAQGYNGGTGSYTAGLMSLNKGETLYVYVGASGNTSGAYTSSYNGGGAGAYDGGEGDGPTNGEHGYSGGGATDIRLVDGDWNNDLSLNSRIIVSAGGTGRSKNYADFENGGGLYGYYNKNITTNVSQTTGYAFGYGQDGFIRSEYSSGGGDIGSVGSGSGYFGGYTGNHYAYKYVGDSGSSFISGHTGSVAITSETDRTSLDKYMLDFDVRYIEVSSNGNTVNKYNQISEIEAIIEDGTNVALNKVIDGIVEPDYSSRPLSLMNNGINETDLAMHVGPVTVDLGQEYKLENIKLLRYYADGRTYNETYIKVYNEDKTMSAYLHNYETDGTYAETSAGKTINLSCSTGTTMNDCSVHYSGKVFTDTVMIDGYGYSWSNIRNEQVQMPKPDGTFYDLGLGHTGNGVAKISLVI